MESSAQSLREVVGENVRTLRAESGLSQDEVAQKVRPLGLMWSRSKVAALERGDKAISLEELILLARAMDPAIGRPMRLSEFFEGTGAVALSSSESILRSTLRRFLSGDEVIVTVRDVPGMPELMKSALSGWKDQLASQVHLMGPAGSMRISESKRILAARGEAVSRASRALGLQDWELAAISAGLWGRTLTEERDHRAEVALGDGPRTAGTLAATRGRVTRDLVKEARAYLAERQASEPEPGPEMLSRTEADGTVVHYFAEGEADGVDPEEA